MIWIDDDTFLKSKNIYLNKIKKMSLTQMSGLDGWIGQLYLISKDVPLADELIFTNFASVPTRAGGLTFYVFIFSALIWVVN